MLGLIASVERLVVRRAVLPHLPKDFEPALAQAAQGAGVALTFGAVSLVIGLRPGAGLTTVVGPLMHGAAQGQITSMPQAMTQDFPRLNGDRGCASVTLQTLGRGEAIPIVSHLGQEPRRQLRPGAGE